VIPLLGLVGLLQAAAAQEREAPEHELKAALLYNIATFVEWPDDAFPNKESPFVIGIFGQDPFGPTLESTLRGKTLCGRRIAIKRTSDKAELRNCQLVYVPGAETARTEEVLEGLKGTPALTMGESPGFASEGGCINFFIEGKRMRFEINPEAAKRSHLRVSSKLLRLARVVEDKR
jgi:YfiR/HmsC-like